MEDGALLVGMVLIAIAAFWVGLIVGVSVGEHWARVTRDDDDTNSL